MTNFTQAQRTQLLRILRRGIRNAQNARTIALQLNFPVGGNQGMTRSLIRECIEEEHDLIASTLSTPKGYYLINNVNELNEYLDSLESRIIEINDRRSHLIRSWNSANNRTKRRHKKII